MVLSTTIVDPGAEGATRGVADLISRYQARAAAERDDFAGYSLARWGYAQLQVLRQAAEANETLDDAKLADYLREQVFAAVVGANGEWAQTPILQSDFRTQTDPTSLNSRTCPLRS
jgi:branched-chain amino acid transport system substrate-binding protein